jgi:glycosyltransferase involved in cell wall biosynthesis
MRILHTESSPSLGGQEFRILVEMEGLQARGIESILVARPDTPIVQEAQRRGLTVHGISMRMNLHGPSMWQMGRLIRRHDIDIVNAHNSKDAWNALPVARLLGKKTVRARHIANRIRRGRLNQLVYGPLADVVMTTGEGIKSFMIEDGIPEAKILSVPTGIDMARFAGATPGSLRRDLDIPADAPLVGQVAVLRLDRGPHYFVQAAKIAIARGSNAYFVLVGDGYQRQELEAMVAAERLGERIKIAGFRRDIPEVLADLDLYAIASCSAEGVSQGVLQAHSAKVPVVATRQVGLSEIAIDGETALSVPPENPEAMAEAFLTLLADPARAARLAEGGYALTAARYTLAGMLDKMEALYHRLLAEER